MIANLALIFVNRSWRRPLLETLRSPNPALWWMTGATAAFLGLARYVPALRDLFRFSALHADEVALCIVAGVLSIGWFEVLKVVQRKREVGKP